MICFIYEPVACHSYNIVKEKGYNINIATIDTILSFYLAFIYIKRPYYSVHRLLCMASFLFNAQEENRLEQRGLLRRFSIDCVGHQHTMEEIRAQKALKYNQLSKSSSEYEEYFLRYRPTDNPRIKTQLQIEQQQHQQHHQFDKNPLKHNKSFKKSRNNNTRRK